MPKTLKAADHKPRLLSPTTTTRFAERMLATSRVIAGFESVLADPVPCNIMLRLLQAEDTDYSVALETLELPGTVSTSVKDRYVAMLVKRGWIEQRVGLLGLTCAGYAVVVELIEAIYSAQRALD